MAEAGPTQLETIHFDTPQPYRKIHEAQLDRRAAVEAGEAREALFLLEHTPVITLGRNAHEEHLTRSREGVARLGVDVVEVDRGGDVTFHGPGQLVGYPILDLNRRELSITGYLRRLEQVVIETLASFGLEGGRLEKYTGVWVDGAKVAAIGIGVHHGVTYHGTAINVSPDMTQWELIVPCGIPDKPVTSMERLRGHAPAMQDVGREFDRVFRAQLGEVAADA